jgi:hypothetical protein
MNQIGFVKNPLMDEQIAHGFEPLQHGLLRSRVLLAPHGKIVDVKAVNILLKKFPPVHIARSNQLTPGVSSANPDLGGRSRTDWLGKNPAGHNGREHRHCQANDLTMLENEPAPVLDFTPVTMFLKNSRHSWIFGSHFVDKSGQSIRLDCRHSFD